MNRALCWPVVLVIFFAVFHSLGQAGTYEEWNGISKSTQYRQDLYPGSIAWSTKDHTFSSVKNSHNFSGTWDQFWSLEIYNPFGSEYNSGLYHWRVEASVQFDKTTKQFTESVTFTCLNFGSPLRIEAHNTGNAATDPWLNTLTNATMDSVLWQQYESSGLVQPDFYEIPLVTPAELLSRHAYSPSERDSLIMESIHAEPPVCSDSQLRKSPVFKKPKNNDQFENPEDVVAQLEIDCYWPPAEDQSKHAFELRIEEKIWDNDSYSSFWIPYDSAGQKLVLVAAAIEGFSGGSVNLGLTADGVYRVKARNYSSTTNDWTEWIRFQVGEIPEVSVINKELQAIQATGNIGSVAGATSISERRPDLIVDDFASVRSDSGVQLKWLVRNIGTSSAPSSELQVCCQLVGPGECPPVFGSPEGGDKRCRIIPVEHELYPKPEGVPGMAGGGAWIGLEQPAPFINGMSYRLSARIDPAGVIEEVHEFNNVLNTTYPEVTVGVAVDPGASPQGSSVSILMDRLPIEGKIQESGGLLKPETGTNLIGTEDAHGTSETIADLPDLQADFEAIRSQNPDYSDRYIMVFRVKNLGKAPSTVTRFAVFCEKVGGGTCPEWFAPSYDLKELAPGEAQLFNTGWSLAEMALLPPAGVRYKLTGVVDPDHTVEEGLHDDNNQTVAYFPSIKVMPGYGELQASATRIDQSSPGATLPGQLKPQMRESLENTSRTPVSTVGRSALPAPTFILTGKKIYAPREQVMLMIQGQIDDNPVVECSADGLRWAEDCPSGITVRRIGSGPGSRFVVQSPVIGKFRLRAGAAVSGPFEVTAAARSEKLTVGSPPPISVAGAKIEPTGAPSLRLHSSNLQAPALVKLQVTADPKFKITYLLEKKDHGSFRKVANSGQPEFMVDHPGDYRVKARYEGGDSDAVLFFAVKPNPTPGTAVGSPVPAGSGRKVSPPSPPSPAHVVQPRTPVKAVKRP